MIGSAAGAFIGFVFYYLLRPFFGKLGLIIMVVFAAIGYGITMIRIPDNSSVGFLKRISGERLDDVILRIIKFKAKGKRIYVYTKEEDKK